MGNILAIVLIILFYSALSVPFLVIKWRYRHEPKGSRYPKISDEEMWYYYDAPR